MKSSFYILILFKNFQQQPNGAIEIQPRGTPSQLPNIGIQQTINVPEIEISEEYNY